MNTIVSGDNRNRETLQPSASTGTTMSHQQRTSKDIQKDQEFVTPVNRDYIVRKKHATVEKASCGDNELAAQKKTLLFIEAERKRFEKARENKESFLW
jgi:hypothetical protein